MKLAINLLSALAILQFTLALEATATNKKTSKPKQQAKSKAPTRAHESDFGLALDYYNLGCEATQAKDYRRAIIYYARARKADPNFLAPYNNEGCAYMALGRNDLAFDVLNAGAELDKKVKNIEADEKYSELYYNRGLMYMKMKKFDKAAEDFSVTIKFDKSRWRGLARAYRGVSYAELSDYQNANSDFNTVLKLPYTDNATLNARVIANTEMQRAKRKMEFETTRRLSDALSLMDKKNYALALETIQAAAKIAPSNVNVLLARGSCYGQMQKFTEADADFDAAQKMDAKNGKIPYTRGLAHIAQHKYDAALQNSDEAIALGFRNPSVYANKGLAQLFLGDFDKSLESLNEAIRLSPNDSNLYNLRALVNLIDGNNAPAVNDATHYLDATKWQGERSEDCALLIYMCNRQLQNDEAAKKMLDEAATHIKEGQWPQPVVRYLKDEIKAEELLSAATTANEKTDAHAWIGIKSALAGDKDKALSEFYEVRKNGVHTRNSFMLAIIQLGKLLGTKQVPGATAIG